VNAAAHLERHELPLAGGAADGAKEVLFLSSSLLTDRMLFHSQLLEELAKSCTARIWTAAPRQEGGETAAAVVESLPAVAAFREFPHNYLRRLNEFAWDFRLRPPSRVSIDRHIKSNTMRAHVRALKLPARLLALVGAHRPLETGLESLLLRCERSPEATERLRRLRPAAVVTTGPFQFEQPAVVAAARRLGIPCLALIPSWDNISTKNRLVFRYDGFIVWSDATRRELYDFYPYSREVPVYVVEAPQFDVFYDEKHHLSRADFCASQGLTPSRPIVVFALGSPNLFREHHAVLELVRRVERGDLGRVQVIVRPHPIHDYAALAAMIGSHPGVIVQRTAVAGTPIGERYQDRNQIEEWVNTFRHADVLVNLASTATIDAALFDRPVVNLDFDPEPGSPNAGLVRDVNHLWTHFKPIAESGGVWLARDCEEMIEAIRTYLERPDLHREGRRWIAQHVCEFLDGRSGVRMAQAVSDFVHDTVRCA